MELADQQVSDNEGSGGLSGPEIPAKAADVPASQAPAEKAPDKPLSLREQINKSVEAVRTEEAKRARDVSTGKFIKTPEGEAKPAEQPPSATEIQSEKKEAQGDAPKAFAPPPGFSAETKAFLATLPADHPIKKDLEKREGEVSNGIKQYSDKAKQYDAIDQVIAPVRSTFQQAGITNDADAIKALLGWEAGFRNPATRAQSFRSLAQQYGFDLSTLVPSSPSGSPSAAQDIPDQLRPVIDQFGQVSQQVQQVASRVESWEQQQAAREINAFASKHPHFEAVRGQMGQLMNAGMVQPGDLEGAYQMAIKINPEISARIAEEERAKTEEAAKAAAAEKARKAAAAAVSPPTRSPVGPSGPAPTGKNSGGVRDSILSSIKALREEQRA